MGLLIERLNDLTPADVADVLSESEQLGSRIVRRLVDAWADATNRFDRPGEALFGARVDGRLVGVCGLSVDPYAGDDRVGRVRHLYVLTAFRRSGVGRQLVMHIIQAARGRFDDLQLRTNNPAAARLYETLGFARCERPADATHVATLAALPDRRPCDSGTILGASGIP